MDSMLLHGKAVRKFVKRSLLVLDMPYNTYLNKFSAYKNAKKILRSTKCDAVKLEGGKKIEKIVKYLTKKGISVMGHVGLLPQSSVNFKLRGKNDMQQRKILKDAKILSKAGVFLSIIHI